MILLCAITGFLIGIWAEHKFDLYYRLYFRWRQLRDWLGYRR